MQGCEVRKVTRDITSLRANGTFPALPDLPLPFPAQTGVCLLNEAKITSGRKLGLCPISFGNRRATTVPSFPG